MRLTRTWKRIGGVALVAFVALNGIAYRQARAFTHFASTGQRTRWPQRLSLVEKTEVLMAGAVVPRPENRRTPRDVGLEFERHVFAGGRGVPLEAWLVPCASARGTVVLFHGHAGSKDSLLREARAFHEMGFRTLLVDFYGSGGSAGHETSIGFFESADVVKAFEYAGTLPGAGPVILYGQSMGAAAVLKGVADARIRPAALVLECPFDSLAHTVRRRFRSFGVPSFPSADLLLFWGGAQQGFNPFAFRPADSAASIDVPTLILNGGSDPWVTRNDARAIFRRLKGPKSLRFFEGLGHGSCLAWQPVLWRELVTEALDRATARALPRDGEA
jgi:alpha-beta hydrolase superfamily lysophospholipase